MELKQSTSTSESSKKEKKKNKKKEKKKKQKRKKLQAKDESPEDKLKAVSIVVIEQWFFIVCVAVDTQLHAAASWHPSYSLNIQVYSAYFFSSWRDSPIMGLGLLLIHEDFCGF